MSKIFLLYDGRAKLGDEDDANVMDVAHSEEEARESGEVDWGGHDAIWYEYDDPGEGKTIRDGKKRWDLPPACTKQGSTK